MDIRAALARLAEGKNLTQAETRDVFRLVMSGEATPAQIGGMLMAMRVKGETAEEIAGAADEQHRTGGEGRRRAGLLAGLDLFEPVGEGAADDHGPARGLRLGLRGRVDQPASVCDRPDRHQ